MRGAVAAAGANVVPPHGSVQCWTINACELSLLAHVLTVGVFWSVVALCSAPGALVMGAM